MGRNDTSLLGDTNYDWISENHSYGRAWNNVDHTNKRNVQETSITSKLQKQQTITDNNHYKTITSYLQVQLTNYS